MKREYHPICTLIPCLRSTHRLWLSGYEESKPLVTHVQTLNAARKAAALTNTAFYSTPLKLMSVTANSLAVSKPPLLALLSNRGNLSSPEWTVASAGYQAGEKLVDVLSCTEVTADNNGGVTVEGTGGMPQVCSDSVLSAGT